jgi:hypothetical protein
MSERSESSLTGTDEQDGAAPVTEAAQLDDLDVVADGEPDAEPPIDTEPPIWSAEGVGSPGSPVSPANEARKPSLLRPRNLVIAGIAAAAVASAAVFGPMAWEVWNEKDVKIATPTRVAGLPPHGDRDRRFAG